MAYSSFKLADLHKKFGTSERIAPLFENVSILNPTDWLKESLDLAFQMPLLSEKAKSELIVTPILVDFWKQTNNQFSFYSGIYLDADVASGLNGECDYILSLAPRQYTLSSPIFTMVEAKNDNLDLGMGQCVAQMLGAKVFNENDGTPLDTIFGCVTTGEDWQFLKLQDKLITIDNKHYYISEVEKILGVLQAILNHYKK